MVRNWSYLQATAWGAAALLAGCTTASEPSRTVPPLEPAAGPVMEEPTIEEAREMARENALEARAARRNMTFEQFEASVYKEPFEGGKYIVGGDTPIADRKHLQEFFEQQIQAEAVTPPPGAGALILHQVRGLDAAWNHVDKQNLTYCVSTAFGSRYQRVVDEMAAATAAWEVAADVDFVHLADQDRACTATNPNVVFDVRPIDVDGEFLARAFFPNEPRRGRNVLIDDSSFNLSPTGRLQLAGILRHELGHGLGFRHEHTRPESGACFEDADWRPLTSYDAFSVMHYPQCRGQGDWSLTLTSLDQNGAACLYQPAAGFTVDQSICRVEEDGDGPPPGTPVVQSFVRQSVARGAERRYGPFAVAAGTVFDALMTGRLNPGDPDLYVRFGGQPTVSAYDCRPYLSSATEQCAIDVPSRETQAFVMVRGYTRGSYDLQITHTPPAQVTAMSSGQ